MTTFLTPNCPLCGEPPFAIIGSGQAFCGTDSCEMFIWDPSQGPEQLADASAIELTEDENGMLTSRPQVRPQG